MDFENLDEFKISPEVVKRLKNHDYLKKALSEGKSLQEILGYDNQTLDKFYIAASHLFEQQQYKDAGEAFFFLTHLNPNVYAFWLGLGMSDHLCNEYRPALISYAMAAALDPENPLPFYHSASCYYALHDSQEALNFVDAALQRSEGKDQFKSLKEQALALKSKLSS